MSSAATIAAVPQPPSPQATPSAAASCPPPPLPFRPGDWRDGLPVLRGQGVTLREPDLADARSLCALLTTAPVTRFISRPPGDPVGFGQFVAWAQTARRTGQCLVYALVPDGHSEAVGLIQARQLEPGFTSAEWGFALGRPYWGSGLFLESARLAVDFLFRHAGVHRLEARAAVQNGRGNGILRKLGAEPEGVLRKSFRGQDQSLDQILWSMRGDDWLRHQAEATYTIAPPLRQTPETVSQQPAPAPTPTPSWCQQLPHLSDGRLTLRELQQSDAASLIALLAGKDVGRYILPPPKTVPGFKRFIEWTQQEREAGRYVCYGVVPGGQEDAVGIFQLHRLDPSFGTAEWGFILGAPYWGTGVYARGARLLLDFAFDTVGVRRLEARAAIANGRGNGALQKMGAVREGRLRRSFLLGGEYFDDALWSILDEDWRRLRARPR